MSTSTKTTILSDLIIKAYGPAAWPAVAYALATAHTKSLFRQTRCMPHLLVYGERGSGKSSLLRALAALTGDHHLLYVAPESNGKTLLTANGATNNLVVVDGLEQLNTPSLTSMLGSLYFRHFPHGVETDELITSRFMCSGYAIATLVRPVGHTLLERCVVIPTMELDYDNAAYAELQSRLAELQHKPDDHAWARKAMYESGALLSSWIADVQTIRPDAPEPNRAALHAAMLFTVLETYGVMLHTSKAAVLRACSYVNEQ